MSDRGRRRGLPVRPAGAGDQRGLSSPAAARPQCRRAPGGGDLVPRRAREPQADGRVGPDHCCRPGDRRDPAAGGSRHTVPSSGTPTWHSIARWWALAPKCCLAEAEAACRSSCSWKFKQPADGIVVAPEERLPWPQTGGAGHPARRGDVRRHGARPPADGLRRQHRGADERRRHADLLRRRRRPGAELSRLVLLLHRRGHRRHRLCRPGRTEPQHRRGAGRHCRLRRRSIAAIGAGRDGDRRGAGSSG